MDIYKKQMSGGADAEALIVSSDWKTPRSWSPDGRFLLYTTIGGGKKGEMWVLPLVDHLKPVPFLRTQFSAYDGRFSPDGRWVAFISDASGRDEVYVRAFSPAASGETISADGNASLISNGGGQSPFWRQDGKELYYIAPHRKVMAVDVTTTQTAFQANTPRVLFQAPPSTTDQFGLTKWASSPDGKRFLFLVPESQEEIPFTVMMNWQAPSRE